MAFIAPIDRKGDASEYILSTESLYFDHDLIFEPRDLQRNAMLRGESLLDIPGGFDAVPGSDGKRRYGYHSFYYSLAVTPLYALLGHRAFFVFNAICVWVLIAVVYAYFARRESEPRAFAFAAGGVFLSALWSYVFFTTTEAFYAGLLAVFFYLWATDRPRRAALVGGIAFGAQIPLGALALPFAWDLARRRQWRSLLVSGLVIAACVAPQLLYNVTLLRGPFPMHTAGNATLSHLEWRVVLSTLVDPSMGVFWFYPVVVYCLANAKYDARTMLVLVACGLVVLAMNTPWNIYSHQVGIRFAACLFPAFLFSTHRLDTSSVGSRLGIVMTVAIGAGLAMNPLGNTVSMDLRRTTFLPYRVAALFPTYHENPEVFEASSVVPRTGRVFARDAFTDGFTIGGGRARLLLQGVQTGRLELKVASWARLDRAQTVTIRLLGGKVFEGRLPPDATATIALDLGDTDVFRYPRFQDTLLAYLDLEAEAWVPQWDAPRLESKDARRLGVQLLGIRSDGRELLTR